ncbi:restriction endonuclease [Funiculus sociatus GB2-A5]|uniref:Restriction endonuclease n=1 Tax=Funiculus sociatus GB2-A5 TaxID=2933946 RepID=A0ABV0JPL3_9CYAN|nr:MULTISPECIES: restriction endonuclease [unclassified Trichocoleus]MBD1907629.1 restriction endonuclease [Trichocoleus sp. FACHB-832]MBD2062937.1 restriction endonuclease [Trichocoleus sp. FACHB-6]
MGKGKTYELDVASLLQQLLDQGELGIHPEQARIQHKPAYYSRDRMKDILFDVSIEVCRRGASTPFWIWIWECKNYSHTIPVDDVEEFHAKLNQVGADRTKGTMITPIGFDEGAYEFARSKGIGLWRWIPKDTPVIRLDTGSELWSQESILYGLMTEITPGLPDGEFIYGLTTNGQLTTKRSELISLEFMDAQSNASLQ